MADETNPTPADDQERQDGPPAADAATPAAEELPVVGSEAEAPAPEQPPAVEAPATPVAEAPPVAAAAPEPDATPQDDAASEAPGPAEAPATDAQAPPAPAPAEAPAANAQAPPAPAEAPAANAGAPPAPAEAPATDAAQPGQPAGEAKPKRNRRPRNRKPGEGGDRPRPPRPPRQPRERGPLPFDELRAAATTTVALFGGKQALKDAFSVLGEKERKDLSRLVADDADWRKRARAIAAGSLGAGRVGKALAAQQISMAQIEELWSLTLSKEEADTRLARVRDAKRRDEERAKRKSDRENSSDRVSRADLKKAQDGRVGAQIRVVIGGVEQGGKPRREEKDKQPEPEQKGSSVLDRLGY